MYNGAIKVILEFQINVEMIVNVTFPGMLSMFYYQEKTVAGALSNIELRCESTLANMKSTLAHIRKTFLNLPLG